MLCRGAAWGCCPSPHAEGCVLAALCARSGGQAALCVRQRPMQQICARLSWLQRQGRCGKTALILAAVADARDAALVLAVRRRQASATQMATALRGCRHRGTDQPASLRRSRHPERHRSRHIADPRSAALVRILCPCEELQQPVESCPCDALNSPALCCLGGPGRHTSTQGPGLRACTHLLLRPMQDSSTIRRPVSTTPSSTFTT